MPGQSRLFQRDGKWTFRVAVPADVREKIGKREIWKSFGSVSYAEARRLARVESVIVDARIDAARTGEESAATEDAPVSEVRIMTIAQKYLHRLEGAAAPPAFDATEREARRELAAQELENLSCGVEDPGLQRIAMRIAGDEKIDVQRPQNLLRMTEAIQRALIEHYSREEDRACLRSEGRYDPAFLAIGRGDALPAPALTLADAIKQYKADPERAGVAKKTRAAYEFRYAVIEELFGADREVGGITRADVRSVRDTLLKLPANAKKRFPNMHLRDIADTAVKQGIKPMSAKSAALYIEALSALFKWLEREEMAPRNPAVGLKGPALPDETSRRPFTAGELKQLFAAPAFNGEKGRGWMFWLPRIALYTGARFAEILALRVSDVVTEDGVLCFSIVPTEDRKLKTKGSKRLVPVHPVLVAAGFADYVAEVPKGGLLFPDAGGPKDMITARNKETGRALRSIFADRALVFHGLRHAFKDAAARARLPRDIIALIGGWDLPGGRAAMDGYGRDKLIPVLAEEIAKVKFEGVDL